MQPTHTRPDWILFDAAGTLIQLSEPVGVTYAAKFAQFGIRLSPDALESAFRTAWKLTPAPPVTPGPRPDDDRGWWCELVQKTLELAGENLPAGQFHECFDALYEHFSMPGVWQLMPHVEDVLSALHGGFRLAVLSNFDKRLHRILHDLGVDQYFEHVLVSSQLGADKPAPEAFQRTLDILGSPPGQVLHVGDDPVADWQGARNAGLHVFELRSSVTPITQLLERVRNDHI